METFDGGGNYQPSSVEVLYDELEDELRKLTANSQKAVLKLLEESTVEADLLKLTEESGESLSKLLELINGEEIEADLLRLTEESNREWLAVLKRENAKYE